MNLKTFAETNRLNVVRDECGDEIIPGANGHIGDGYNDGLGVYVNGESSRSWTFTRHKMESAGMRIRQNGDVDGVAVFDPTDPAQPRLAIEVAGIKTRRISAPPTPAQLAARAAFAANRKNALKAA